MGCLNPLLPSQSRAAAKPGFKGFLSARAAQPRPTAHISPAICPEGKPHKDTGATDSAQSSG